MLQKIILAVAVFVVILLALIFGEAIAHDAFAWLSHLTGMVIDNFADVYYLLKGYLSQHTVKVLIALLLTVPITLWIIKNKGDELNKPRSHRKIAIVLAVFLGWLGVHRFYLGQIGIGIVFLVVFYLFTPLAVVLGLIDAIRYLFMSDEEFEQPRV
ncbi:MAG: TM2 domain-containing protein [Burkholderiaceae bacterium]